jgi:hypothetical protein
VEIAGESELSLRQHGSPVVLSFALLCCSPRHAVAQFRSYDSLPRITSITLVTNSIFDRNDSSLLARIGNLIHVSTRPAFIRREFLFRLGDRYDSARVAETGRNLRALGVFRGVAIDTTQSDSGVDVHVVTRDAFTSQIQPTLRTSGGSSAYGLTLLETNFLGTLSQLEAGYRHDPDRSTYVLGFSRRRLINDKIGGTVELFDRSDGKLAFAQLLQPYFEAASRVSGTLTFDDRRDRILQYRDGVLVPEAIVQNRYVLGRVDYGRALSASPHGYLRIGGAIQARRDDYISDSEYTARGFGTSSVTGAAGVYVDASRVNEPKVFAFASLGRDEDVDLSTTVHLALFAAPAAFGYRPGHSGVAPGISLHTGTLFPGGFVYIDASATGLYSSIGLDSGQVFLGGTAVLMPARRHQLLLHGEASALQNPLPGTEFDLGLGAGPRAFAQHSFTGDREYFGTAEYRYTAGLNVFKLLDVGFATFVDRGGAWWAGDPHRSGWDYGIGLRLGFSRAPDVGTNRIDFAWRAAHDGIPGGWAFAVGKGFAFSSGLRGTAR